jgi:formylglycine-generating enzyme required for sulfatase activity
MASRAQEITFRVGEANFVLRRIPPGEFYLGSPASDPMGKRWEMPQRRVRISKAFYMGKFEVTQLQYREVMGPHRSKFDGDLLPVDQVRYSEAMEFCRRLSSLTGAHVSLPTEAEWEYACRAGTKTRYYSGNEESDLDRVAWFRKNSDNTTHEVGKKEPNAFGLYDMLGNIMEPCADSLPAYDTIKETDPMGYHNGFKGALRGGGWHFDADSCRAAAKAGLSSDMFGGMGIRIIIKPGE